MVTVSPCWRIASAQRRNYSPRRESKNASSPMSFFRMLFGWWHAATIGTLVTTWLSGRLVGSDEFGNRYYESKTGQRRWVIYAGTVDASLVPADWHGWLHHTFTD